MALLNPGAATRRRRASLSALAAMALGLVGGPPALAQGPALEYAVKANYLYKLGPFVEWPPNAFPGASRPFTVCTLGEDPFGRALDDAVRAQSVAGRPIAVHRIATVGQGAACHVLYLGRSSPSAGEVLRGLRGAPVLVVTDERSSATAGMVHFVLRDGRVRFALDPHAARASGLTFSSKLLSLAAPVRRPGV